MEKVICKIATDDVNRGVEAQGQTQSLSFQLTGTMK
jgi:hypothetical protein